MERITVKTNIIRIGNSQGIRIPKLFLDQSGLGEEVELEVQHGQIVIRRVSRPREGWVEKFRSMSNKGDDSLLDPDMTGESSWDKNEWQWE
jgi:antitoxin MazE